MVLTDQQTRSKFGITIVEPFLPGSVDKQPRYSQSEADLTEGE
jgi:hypothetical protein